MNDAWIQPYHIDLQNFSSVYLCLCDKDEAPTNISGVETVKSSFQQRRKPFYYFSLVFSTFRFSFFSSYKRWRGKNVDTFIVKTFDDYSYAIGHCFVWIRHKFIEGLYWPIQKKHHKWNGNLNAWFKWQLDCFPIFFTAHLSSLFIFKSSCVLIIWKPNKQTKQSIGSQNSYYEFDDIFYVISIF